MQFIVTVWSEEGRKTKDQIKMGTNYVINIIVGPN